MQRSFQNFNLYTNCLLPLFLVMRKDIFKFLQELQVLHIYMLKLHTTWACYIIVHAFENIESDDISII